VVGRGGAAWLLLWLWLTMRTDFVARGDGGNALLVLEDAQAEAAAEEEPPPRAA
jgi:hypothetical protein